MNNCKTNPAIKMTARRAPGFTRRFMRDERGLSSVEYVILLVVIVVGSVGVWKEIGTEFGKGLNEAKGDMMLLNKDDAQ